MNHSGIHHERLLVQATGGLDSFFRRARGDLVVQPRQHTELIKEISASLPLKLRPQPLHGRYVLQRWIVPEQLLSAKDIWFGGSQVTVRLVPEAGASREISTVKRLCDNGGEFAHISPILNSFSIHASKATVCLVYPQHDRTLADAYDLSIRSIREQAFQILTALAFLERQELCHGRLRHSSVLVFDEPAPRISLVGVQQLSCPEGLDDVYTAPELLADVRGSSSIGTHAGDMWSLGTILAELYGSSPLFDSANLAGSIAAFCGESREARVDHLYRRLKCVQCPSFLLLLISCLEREPTQRISAVQALAHPFFLPIIPLVLLVGQNAHDFKWSGPENDQVDEEKQEGEEDGEEPAGNQREEVGLRCISASTKRVFAPVPNEWPADRPFVFEKEGESHCSEVEDNQLVYHCDDEEGQLPVIEYASQVNSKARSERAKISKRGRPALTDFSSSVRPKRIRKPLGSWWLV